MAKLLIVLFFAISLSTVATRAHALKWKNDGEAEEVLESNEESGILKEALEGLDDTLPDAEKYSALVLRNIESTLKTMANEVRKRRALICSTTPRPYCDLG